MPYCKYSFTDLLKIHGKFVKSATNVQFLSEIDTLKMMEDGNGM